MPWPEIGKNPPKTIADMIMETTAGLGEASKNKLEIYLDVRMFSSEQILWTDCYIKLVGKEYKSLFFRVEHPLMNFPVKVSTPFKKEKDTANNEQELATIIAAIIALPETAEMLDFHYRIAG